MSKIIYTPKNRKPSPYIYNYVDVRNCIVVKCPYDTLEDFFVTNTAKEFLYIKVAIFICDLVINKGMTMMYYNTISSIPTFTIANDRCRVDIDFIGSNLFVSEHETKGQDLFGWRSRIWITPEKYSIIAERVV